MVFEPLILYQPAQKRNPCHPSNERRTFATLL